MAGGMGEETVGTPVDIQKQSGCLSNPLQGSMATWLCE